MKPLKTRRALLIVATATLVVLGCAVAAAAEVFWGLTTANTLVRFSSAAPGTLLANLPVIGLAPGERMLAINVYQ